jgi:hypothetical protein
MLAPFWQYRDFQGSLGAVGRFAGAHACETKY